MIMIIAIIYIFLTYVMFDQQLKITFRKSPDPLKKIPTPLKIQNLQVTTVLPTLKIFWPPLQKGGKGHCGNCQYFHPCQFPTDPKVI